MNLFAKDLESYRMAADDQITITVFGEPDLSLEKVRIATNGTISMPLIGQIKVSGQTATEVEKKITSLLADGYLKKPGVTVSIVEYRLFYITGEVKKPGGYGYRDGLTVHKAVSLAGGFSERANQNNITIMHEDSTKEMKGAKLNDRVRPGDIINIKESFF
jgi:polysaccharide export outer membrane protein